MKNCNCKDKEVTPCNDKCVIRLMIDECSGNKINYITLASAVLMGCNDTETVEDVLNEIQGKLNLIDSHIDEYTWDAIIAFLKNNLTRLEPELTNLINSRIENYFLHNDFAGLKQLFRLLFAEWETTFTNLIERIGQGISREELDNILNTRLAPYYTKAEIDALLSNLGGVKGVAINGASHEPDNNGLVNLGTGFLKSDNLDTTPTSGSFNPVTSNGIYNALQNLEQPDWNETDSRKHSFIKNKPNISDQYPNAIHVFQELPNQLDIEQIYVKCYSIYQYNFLKYHIDDKTDPDDLGMVRSVLLGLYLDNLDQRTTLDNASFGLVPISTLQADWNSIDPNHVINYNLITINDVAYYKLPIIPRTILLIREALNRGETLDVILINRCLNELLGKSFTGFNIMEVKNVIHVDENGVQHNITLKDDNTYYDVEHGCYVHVYSENGTLYIKFISQPINVPEEAIMDTMDLNDIDYLYSLGMQVYLVHKFSDISNVKIHLNARNSSSIYGTTLLGSYLFHAEVNSNGAVVRKYTVNDVEDCETGGRCEPVTDPTII